MLKGESDIEYRILRLLSDYCTSNQVVYDIIIHKAHEWNKKYYIKFLNYKY